MLNVSASASTFRPRAAQPVECGRTRAGSPTPGQVGGQRDVRGREVDALQDRVAVAPHLEVSRTRAPRRPWASWRPRRDSVAAVVLPVPVRAQQAQDLAARDGEREVVHGGGRAEALGQAGDLDGGSGQAVSSRRTGRPRPADHAVAAFAAYASRLPGARRRRAPPGRSASRLPAGPALSGGAQADRHRHRAQIVVAHLERPRTRRRPARALPGAPRLGGSECGSRSVNSSPPQRKSRSGSRTSARARAAPAGAAPRRRRRGRRRR